MSLCVRLKRLPRLSSWKRIEAEISAYEKELAARQKREEPSEKFTAITDALSAANDAVVKGEIERAWRCYHLSRRLYFFVATPAELYASAVTLRHEAEKLRKWRKDAIEELLNEGCDDFRARIYEAASLKDEHFANEAYKDGLLRWRAIHFAVIIPLLLAAFSGVAFLEHAPNVDMPVNPWGALPLVWLAGLLGAAVSAVTNLPSQGQGTRIPELAATLRVTMLRLLTGAAMATIIYTAAKAGVLSNLFNMGSHGVTLFLCIAAGFSERLVPKVMETFASQK